MSKHEEPSFSDDDEQNPLMTEKELREACLYAAAIVVAAFSLGCEFKDCTLDDIGAVWRSPSTRIAIEYPEDWRWKFGIFPVVGAIHEAGAAAVCKQRDIGLCRINSYTAPGASALLNDPTIWATIKALARFIQDNDEDHGCHGALGTACHEPGDEDSYAITLMRSMGVRPGYGWKILRPDEEDS